MRSSSSRCSVRALRSSILTNRRKNRASSRSTTRTGHMTASRSTTPATVKQCSHTILTRCAWRHIRHVCLFLEIFQLLLSYYTCRFGSSMTWEGVCWKTLGLVTTAQFSRTDRLAVENPIQSWEMLRIKVCKCWIIEGKDSFEVLRYFLLFQALYLECVRNYFMKSNRERKGIKAWHTR